MNYQVSFEEGKPKMKVGGQGSPVPPSPFPPDQGGWGRGGLVSLGHPLL